MPSETPKDRKTYLRIVEGVLIYLNAFMILDFMRDYMRGHLLLGMIIMITITIICLWFIESYIRHDKDYAEFNDDHYVMLAPSIAPQPYVRIPVETFHMRHNRRA